MKLHFKPDDLRAKLTHILELAEKLPTIEHDGREWYDAMRRDGYPTSSSSADRQPPAAQMGEQYDMNGDVVVDEHGEPVLAPMPPRSDPTASAATADPDDDPLGKALNELWTQVWTAESALARAGAVVETAMRPGLTPEQETRDWCALCLRLREEDEVELDDQGHVVKVLKRGAPMHVMSPTYRDSQASHPRLAHVPRCRNHYQWALEHGVDAPAGVGRAWARGQRVTSAVVTAAEEELARRRRPQPKRAKRKARAS